MRQAAATKSSRPDGGMATADGEAGMVTENRVWAAADRIRARCKLDGGAKERVSVRTVRKELGGGSHEDIGPPLARWKAKRDYTSP
ncbi:DNA-binding protein [Methylorubrum extorquens]|uniref:DNA-binding protein n=1 Tax=Methylorubrum extorquens TaxID=408 RepID=UPI0009B6CBC6|nr:DNA-binding protein [Methylorubrum extorquens]